MQSMQYQESESETSDENRKRTLDNFIRKLAIGDSALSSSSDIEYEDKRFLTTIKKPKLLL